jgi:protein-disulfide isomerase
MNRGLIVAGIVLLIGIGAFAFNMGAGGSGGTALTPVEFEGMEDPATLARVAQPMTSGSASARISIVEFGDYACPACAGFATTIKPQIDLNYGDAEDVNFVFYDFPITNIHPHAFLAARAARCADDQDRFWEYHAVLFQNQSAWSLAGAPPLGQMEDYAETVGLDAGTFSSCLRSDRYADVVTANLRLGESLGISGTPTVLVSDGTGSPIRIANDFASIRQAVEAAREAAGAAAGDAGTSGEGGA